MVLVSPLTIGPVIDWLAPDRDTSSTVLDNSLWVTAAAISCSRPALTSQF